MTPRRPLRFALLSLLLPAMALPAAAQGIFDKPPIAGAAPDAPAATGTATAPAAEKGPLDFTVSTELRAQNQQKMLAELGTLYPDLVKDMENQDIIGMIATPLAQTGMRVDNLGDAFTAWLLTNHGIVQGYDTDATPAQVEGTKKLAYEAMLALPDLQTMTDADKQVVAEALLLQAIINQVMVDVRKELNPDGVPEAIEEVRKSAEESGIDLDKFVMTPNGLEVVQ